MSWTNIWEINLGFLTMLFQDLHIENTIRNMRILSWSIRGIYQFAIRKFLSAVSNDPLGYQLK